MILTQIGPRVPATASISEIIAPGLVARLVVETSPGFEAHWLYYEEAGTAAETEFLGVFFRVDPGGYGETQMPLRFDNATDYTITVDPVKVPLFFTYQKRNIITSTITDHEGKLAGSTWTHTFSGGATHEIINVEITRLFNHALITKVP